MIEALISGGFLLLLVWAVMRELSERGTNVKINAGIERVERAEIGQGTTADARALARAVRAMERLAEEGSLETSVRGTARKLIKPEDIISTLEEALK